MRRLLIVGNGDLEVYCMVGLVRFKHGLRGAKKSAYLWFRVKGLGLRDGSMNLKEGDGVGRPWPGLKQGFVV